MTSPFVPFNRPSLSGREFDYLQMAIDGGHISASGPFSQRAAELLQAHLQTDTVLLTTSCTDALEMTALLLQITPGDTVILPSFTFVSTAIAFARVGARLRFVDIDRQTLGLDPKAVQEAIDETVRAVVTVHYAGVPSSIEELAEICEASGATLIEDNAHGLFAASRGRLLGTFGAMSTLSFHETKNFSCGEGGALLINDDDLSDRAQVLYHKGTNRRAFELGQVDKYTWCDIGSSFGMSDLLAAYLLAQLEQRDQILECRRLATQRYDDLLRGQLEDFGVEFAAPPLDATPAFHMYYVLLPTKRCRDAVLGSMNADGVHATFHYIPLHNAPGSAPYRDGDGDLPVTEDVAGRILRLPFFTSIDEATHQRVATSLIDAVAKHS